MKMGIETGSLLWLIRWQMRLGWRDATAKTKPWVWILLGLLFFGGLPLLLYIPLRQIAGRISSLNSLQPDVSLLLGASGGLFFLLTLMLSSAVVGTLRALFERGDLDLLLSSPLRSRTIFAARALGVVVSQFLGTAVFVVPIALLGVFLGFWRLLGVIPTLVSLSLLASSLGILLTLGLVRVLGVGRARTAAQIFSALTGAAFFLLFQAQNILGRGAVSELGAGLNAFVSAVRENPNFGPSSIVWYPARSLFLEPLPTLLFLGLSSLVFAWTVNFTRRSFLRGVQNEVKGDRRTRASNKTAHFSGGLFLSLYRKEWRSILRDPLLISQTLLQLLYLIPAFFVFLRPREDGATLSSGLLALSLNAALVFISGTLVSNLARIAISAEDAPDLLRMSPRGETRLNTLKMWVIVLPIFALFALFYALLLWQGLFLAFGLLAFVGASLSSAALELWFPRPTPRADLMKRGGGQTGRFWLGMAHFLTLVGWVGAMYGLETGNVWGFLGLAAGLLIPFVAWLSSGQGRGKKLARARVSQSARA